MSERLAHSVLFKGVLSSTLDILSGVQHINNTDFANSNGTFVRNSHFCKFVLICSFNKLITLSMVCTTLLNQTQCKDGVVEYSVVVGFSTFPSYY